MRNVFEFGEQALATIAHECDRYRLGENDADGEPPTSPEMTPRVAPGQQPLVTEQ